MKHGVRGRLEKHARSFTYWVRNVFEKTMLARVAPKGTVLRRLIVEDCSSGVCYARQPGSYPVMAALPCRLPIHEWLDRVLVTGVHSARSVEAVPIPLARGSRRRLLEKASRLAGERAVFDDYWRTYSC